MTLSRLKIDKTVVIVASLGPLLWIFDSFSNAVIFNESITRQLFLPKAGDLGLRLWLVFFTTLAAFFWARYTALRSRAARLGTAMQSMFDALHDAAMITDETGRIVKINSTAQAVLGYSPDELLTMDLVQVCPEAESERVSGFVKEVIQNGAGVLTDAKVAGKDKKDISVDIKAFMLEDIDDEDSKGIFFDIAERSTAGPGTLEAVVPSQDYERRLDRMRTQIEGEVAKNERTRVERIIKEMEARQDEIVARKVAEARSGIEETVRQEEQQKAREELKAIEQKMAQSLRSAAPLADEEALRRDERAQAEQKIVQLQEKFAQELNAQVAEARRQTEEKVRLEEETWVKERINILEQQHTVAMQAQVEETRRRAEEAVRADEQKKTEEALNTLKASLKQEFEARLEQERQFIEAGVREQEQEKTRQLLSQSEAQFTEKMKNWLQETRQAIEDAVRKEERDKLQAKISELEATCGSLKGQETRNAEALKAKFNEELKLHEEELRKRYDEAMRMRVAEERRRIEDAVRQEEQQKAQEALKAFEQKYTQALQEAAKSQESVQPAVEREPIKIPAINNVIKGLNFQIATPLGSVLNNLKLIKIKLVQGSQINPKDFKDAILAIEENAVLCKNIMYSLVDPAAAGKVSLQPVSLNDLIAKIDNLFGQEWKLQSIIISKQLQANLPDIQGDSALLLQALFNIFSNAKWAIKSSPYGMGGSIIITTRTSSDGKAVQLDIADNGIGIPQQNLARIFEPFFTTRKEGEGLGLGLTVSDTIIRAHNGAIRVQSTENKGTTFSITLPAAG